MSRRPFPDFALALAAALLVAAAPAAAATRFFSYDPANPATQHAAGALTFEFKQKFIWVQVLSVRSTEGPAAAQLRPADEHVLGAGGLSRLIGAAAHERDLYEVQPAEQGAEMIRALCPGSTRAWMAFSRLAEGVPLRVQVLGDAPGGPARLCQTLDFNFRGEWRLPPGPNVPERDLLVPRFPY
jgi:hypothetical protein